MGPTMDNRVGLAIMDELIGDAVAGGARLRAVAGGDRPGGERPARGARPRPTPSTSTRRSRSTSGSPATSRRWRSASTRPASAPARSPSTATPASSTTGRSTQHLLALAARASPPRTACSPGDGSDGLALAESGSPTALVTVATRYTHTAFETIYPGDLDATADLLRALSSRDLSPRGRSEGRRHTETRRSPPHGGDRFRSSHQRRAGAGAARAA